MSTTSTTLHELLGDLTDTHEVVLRDARGDDPVLEVWRAAAADVQDAYAAWAATPGALRYAAYLAACDREDAAVGALAADRGAFHVAAEPHAPRPLAA